MKARLKSTQQERIMLNDMNVGQFAVIVNNDDENGHIIFRPHEDSGIFAVDLTDGLYWIRPEISDREVRILKAGELIEIVE